MCAFIVTNALWGKQPQIGPYFQIQHFVYSGAIMACSESCTRVHNYKPTTINTIKSFLKFRPLAPCRSTAQKRDGQVEKKSFKK